MKIKKLISLSIVSLILALSLAGCGSQEVEDIAFYEGPIEGWTDIAIPENAEWTRSLVDGPVENHNFSVIGMSRGELFSFLDDAMAVNGWTPYASSKATRQFIKNGDMVTYNSNSSSEEEVSFLVIIEPEGVYEDEEDEDDDDNTDEE